MPAILNRCTGALNLYKSAVIFKVSHLQRKEAGRRRKTNAMPAAYQIFPMYVNNKYAGGWYYHLVIVINKVLTQSDPIIKEATTVL